MLPVFPHRYTLELRMVNSYGQVTIAKAIGGHETVWLCIFGVLGLMPFATVRACTNPPVAMPNGVGVLTYTPMAALGPCQRPAATPVASKMPPYPCLFPALNFGPHVLQPWCCRHCRHACVWGGRHQLTVCV